MKIALIVTTLVSMGFMANKCTLNTMAMALMG